VVKKDNTLMGDIGSMTMGGIGLTMGSQMISSLPVTGATAGVTGGLTKFASFYPTLATASVMGHVVKKISKLNKKVKRRK